MGSRAAIEGLIQGCGDTWFDAAQALAWAFLDELGETTRATDVARALAQARPCWLRSLQSARRRALLARASLARTRAAAR